MSKYRLKWLTKSLNKYSSTMVAEFYASYAAIIHLTFSKGKKPFAQPRLTEMRMRVQRVDIFEAIIHHMLFGSKFPTPRSSIEVDYRVGRQGTH